MKLSFDHFLMAEEDNQIPLEIRETFLEEVMQQKDEQEITWGKYGRCRWEGWRGGQGSTPGYSSPAPPCCVSQTPSRVHLLLAAAPQGPVTKLPPVLAPHTAPCPPRSQEPAGWEAPGEAEGWWGGGGPQREPVSASSSSSLRGCPAQSGATKICQRQLSSPPWPMLCWASGVNQL